MHTTESLKQSILAECEDDHVGLWSIVRDVAAELGDANDVQIREETIELISDLLTSDMIEAGVPDSNGRDFHPWPFPPQVIIDKIKAAWKPNSDRPNIGEAVWFTKSHR